MEAEPVQNTGRLAPIQSPPGVRPREGGRPQPAPATQVPKADSTDVVTLSTRGRAAAETGASGGGPGGGRLLRKLDVTEGNQVVLKIVDGTTRRLVRQIPPEEQVRLRQAIQELIQAQQTE